MDCLVSSLNRRDQVLMGAGACYRLHKFRFRHNLYKLREERDMKVETFANMVSAMLYEKR